jgi:hypothetical protein
VKVWVSGRKRTGKEGARGNHGASH